MSNIAANIKLYNQYGEEEVFYGVDTITTDTDTDGVQATFRHNGIVPSGNLAITDTASHDVTQYATAQVVDADLVAGNIREDVEILGVTGTFKGGGSGWNPAGADYTWNTVNFNPDSPALWDALLPTLTYDANGECLLAKAYASKGVELSNNGRLIAYDLTSTTAGWYGVAYLETIDGTVYASGVYATLGGTVLTIGDTGCTWGGGAIDTPQIFLNFDGTATGSLVPLVAIDGDFTAWNDYYAGEKIAFGPWADGEHVDEILSYFGPTQLTSSDTYRFGEGARDYLFYNCSNLETVEFSAIPTFIGAHAFDGCFSLTQATFNAFLSGGINLGLRQIGAYAFNGCYALEDIDLPSTMTGINDYAFKGCTSINAVTIRATSPPAVGTSIFDGCTGLSAIYVPASSVATYKSASGWSAYASIIQAIPT